MAEPWFALSRADQAEALEVAAAATGRPPHLLEKDICTGQHLCALPDDLMKAMLAIQTQPVDLDTEIEGDVAL